jgi:hypothetical protein
MICCWRAARNDLDARRSIRLWNALCHPILSMARKFGSRTKAHSKQIEKVQNWFGRQVLGCTQNTPVISVTSELISASSLLQLCAPLLLLFQVFPSFSSKFRVKASFCVDLRKTEPVHLVHEDQQ